MSRTRSEEGPFRGEHLFGGARPSIVLEPVPVHFKKGLPSGEPGEEFFRLLAMAEEKEGRPQRFRRVQLADSTEVLGIGCD